MKPTKFNLNSDVMTKLVRDVYLPAFETETWTNSGALSESFGMSGIGSSINATSGKLDAYFKKGSIGSVGAFGDDFTFNSGSLKNTGVEAVIRTRGFQANAGISIIPSQRMSGPVAWENIFADNFTDLTTTLKRQYSRMLYGNGSGKISTVSTGGVSFTKEDGSAATSATEAVFAVVKVEDIRSFRIGDLLSFAATAPTVSADNKQFAGVKYDKAGDQTVTSQNRWATHGRGNIGEALASFKIDDIDYSTSEVIIFALAEDGTTNAFTSVLETGTAAKLAAGMEIFYNKSVDSDIHGLDYIIRNKASGTTGYFGLGESEYGLGDGQRPRYLNSHITSVENFLTEDVFMKHYEEIEMIGGTPADLMVTSRGTRRAIASTNQGATQSIVRLMRDASATAANDQRSIGYAGVDLKGEAIEIDRMAPTGKLWALKLDTFDMANEQELTFDDFDGQTWKQVRQPGTATKAGQRVLAYEANMYGYRELFNKNPRNNGFIEIKDAKIVLPTFDKDVAGSVAELGKVTDKVIAG